MDRFDMMERIRKTLDDGEEITVSVAHRGDWHGADIYKISTDGVEHIGHKWNYYGTLMKTYAERVLKK